MKHLCLAAVLTLLVFNTTDCHSPGRSSLMRTGVNVAYGPREEGITGFGRPARPPYAPTHEVGCGRMPLSPGSIVSGSVRNWTPP